jgi:hypothetical protein
VFGFLYQGFGFLYQESKLSRAGPYGSASACGASPLLCPVRRQFAILARFGIQSSSAFARSADPMSTGGSPADSVSTRMALPDTRCATWKHVHDRIALRIGQVERATRATGQEVFERADMRIGNIRHMDIIADAGAVRHFVVVAIDSHWSPITRGGEYARDQMGLRIMRLSDVTIGVGARGVEIAQRD